MYSILILLFTIKKNEFISLNIIFIYDIIIFFQFYLQVIANSGLSQNNKIQIELINMKLFYANSLFNT